MVVLGDFDKWVKAIPENEELLFEGSIAKAVKKEIIVMNTSDESVGYKLKCTNNEVIRLENAVGLLPPGGHQLVTMTAGPFSTPPPPQVIWLMVSAYTKEIACLVRLPHRKLSFVEAAFTLHPEGTGKKIYTTRFA